MRNKRLFIDSDVLIKWVDDHSLDAFFKKISSQFCLIISTVSLLEVGFGPTDKASERQIKFANEIYDITDSYAIDNEFVRNITPSDSTNLGIYVYNPNHHEWYASRHLLVKLMNETGRNGKNARKLANDALIYHCAWNSRSTLITENLKDYILLNSLQVPQKTKAGHCRHVPLFTTNDLIKSFNADISYPENLPNR